MTDVTSSELKFTREERISIPSSDSERRMGVRCADWDRIKKRLSQLYNPIPHLRIAYSVVYGVAATAGLTIIPLTITEGLSPWVIPFYGCVCLFGFICATVFVFIDRRIYSIKTTQISDIIADMDDVEKAHKVIEGVE
jgi:hypothetical protein